LPEMASGKTGATPAGGGKLAWDSADMRSVENAKLEAKRELYASSRSCWTMGSGGGCFYKDNLYSMRFGGGLTDMMERRFFGPIDELGRTAAEHFVDYAGIARGTPDMFQALAAYIGAQRFRTPRGLAELGKRLSYECGR